MRNVFIDGDSVKISRRVAELAEDYGCELIVCSDLSHDESEKATITYRCDTGMDASDFNLFVKCKKGDVVITRDYGLAMLVTAKEAIPLHPQGRVYNEYTLNEGMVWKYLLHKQRHMGKHKHTKERYIAKTHFPKQPKGCNSLMTLEKILGENNDYRTKDKRNCG